MSMRGGTFNLKYGRDPAVVRQEVAHLLEKWDLSFLCVQEAEDYWHELRHLPDYAYHATRDYKGGDQVGILVHRRHTATWPRYRPFGDGWVTVRGGHAAPVTFPCVTIDGWLRLGSIHLPTPTKWEGNALHAPADRLDDYIASIKAVQRFFRVPTKTRLVAGDWNEKPETRGQWSPGWLAEQVHATIEAPDFTMDGHGRIDYPMVKRGTLERVHKDLDIREGSDHEPVLFTVAKYTGATP